MIESISLRVVQLVIGIVLARLLLPEQFGLIGMLTIFFALARSLLDSGFEAALIQKAEGTPEDENTIFLFNLFISSILVAVLFLAAPSVARFYSQPILTPLLRVLAFKLVIDYGSGCKRNGSKHAITDSQIHFILVSQL